MPAYESPNLPQRNPSTSQTITEAVLDKVAVGRATITASYRLNGLNKPRLTVDRRSGRITVIGTANYAFRGTCDMVEDGDRTRF